MRLSLDGNQKGFERLWGCLQMRLSLDGNRKGFKRLWGCWFMIVIWPSMYIHPDGKSIIPEQELSKRVTVFSRSNLGVPRVRCNPNCITQKRGSRLQIRLSVDGDQKGFKRLWGVLIYDHHLAICVYPPLWNLWSPNKNYPREWRYPPEAI